MLDVFHNQPDGLRHLLNIQTGSMLKCHGLTKKDTKCAVAISRANSQNAARLLDKVIANGNLKTAQSLLAELSKLLLCRKNHQEQGKLLVAQWEEALRAAEKRHAASSNAAVKEERPHSERQEIKDEEEDNDDREVVKTESPEVPKDEPQPRLTPSDTIPLRRTRKRREIPMLPAAVDSCSLIPQHHFEPFGPILSIEKINNEIKKKLLRPLSPSQLDTSSESGWIYVYSFPDHYRDAEPYLKIGYTSNVPGRMSKWQRECGYEPKVMFSFRAELYVLVERLVHAHLRNSRKRETACPGCRRMHLEWFDIRSPKVCEIVALWTYWTRQMPYDEDGRLKIEWVAKLKSLDMADPRCWKTFAYGDGSDVTD